MITLGDLIQIIIALITLGGVIAAILSTKWSIDKQNKQSLFEIRSKNYTILALSMEDYGKIKSQIKFDDADQLFADSLVDSTLPLLLGAIGREIDKNRIVKSSLLNAPAFSAYVKEAIERIEYSITEIPLLFSDEVSDAAVKFLINYKEFITELYNYALITEAERRGASTSNKSLEVVGNFYSLGKLTKNLSSNYEKLNKNKTLQKMKDEIKLQKGSKK